MPTRRHRAIISAQLIRKEDVTHVVYLSVTHDDPREPSVFADIESLFIEQFPFDGDERTVTVFATSEEVEYGDPIVKLEPISLRHLRALGYANVTA